MMWLPYSRDLWWIRVGMGILLGSQRRGYWGNAKVDAAVAVQISISGELGCSGVLETHEWLNVAGEIRCKEVRLAGRVWMLIWYWREDRCLESIHDGLC